MVYPTEPSAGLARVLPFNQRESGQAVPARRAITRSKQTVRVRYPPLKARGMIDCESALEGLSALYIDLSPPVKTFRSQPFTVNLSVAGETKRYTPDFEVKLHDGRTLIIEVKPFHRCIEAGVYEKLIAAHHHFSSQNIEYLILTDLDLKPSTKQENLRLLRYYARVNVDHKARFLIRQHVSLCGITTLGDLVGLGFSKTSIYSLIVSQALATDLDTEISTNSPIFIPEENDHEKCLFEGRSALNLK